MAWERKAMCQLAALMAGKKIEQISYDCDANEFTIELGDDLVIKWDESGPWIFQQVFRSEPPPPPSTTRIATG